MIDAPTGYSTVNGKLVPKEMVRLVQRIFAQRNSTSTRSQPKRALPCDDQIDTDTFAEEHRQLTTKVMTLQQQAVDFKREQKIREEAVDKFDLIAELLANMDLERIWNAATPAEQRALVEDLVDSVSIYPDQITVQVAGAPPFIVALDEVGLTQGCIPVVSETVVSETRRDKSATLHWRLAG